LHLLDTAPLKVRGQHFDLVLNGVELGGGSVRIHQSDLQSRIITNILKEDIGQFQAILDALSLGAPPHGGFAFGFDRVLLMLVARYGASSLRDVIAFPKSFAGRELMSGTPSLVTDEELAAYNLQWRPESSQ